MKLFHGRIRKEELDADIYKRPRMDGVLKSLCGDDGDLYEAMTNFLLADPRRQEPQIGSFPHLVEDGMESLNANNKLHARVTLEIAARLALYHQDRSGVMKALELAERATEEEETARHRMHRTLLTNLEKAFDVSGQYYAHLYPVASAPEKQEEKKLLEIAAVARR